jgi:hypothetical protein
VAPEHVFSDEICDAPTAASVASHVGSASTALATSRIGKSLEAAYGYAIRLPAKQVLQNRIAYLLTRPVGRP